MPDKPKSVLTGMLKCAYCNKSMVIETRYRRRFYCHSFNMGIGCEKAAMEEQPLIDAIFAIIKIKLELVQASEQAVMVKWQAKADKRNKEMRDCNKKLMKLKLSQSNALEQFLEGNLTKESYQSQKAQITTAIEEMTSRLASLETQNGNVSEFADKHRPFFSQESLTREMVKELIKEIRITSAEEIEIVWKFQNF
jgi:hypothetical protein